MVVNCTRKSGPGPKDVERWLLLNVSPTHGPSEPAPSRQVSMHAGQVGRRANIDAVPGRSDWIGS